MRSLCYGSGSAAREVVGGEAGKSALVYPWYPRCAEDGGRGGSRQVFGKLNKCGRCFSPEFERWAIAQRRRCMI